MTTCRCGWDGTGEHMCHRCHQRPGTFRLYNARMTALAGVQMKLVAQDTNACDECWEPFIRPQQGPQPEGSELEVGR